MFMSSYIPKSDIAGNSYTMPALCRRATRSRLLSYIERERPAKLKAISERTMIPTSALVRRGIDLVIAEYAKKD